MYMETPFILGCMQMYFGALFSHLSANRGKTKATSAEGGDLMYMEMPFILRLMQIYIYAFWSIFQQFECK